MNVSFSLKEKYQHPESKIPDQNVTTLRVGDKETVTEENHNVPHQSLFTLLIVRLRYHGFIHLGRECYGNIRSMF